VRGKPLAPASVLECMGHRDGTVVLPYRPCTGGQSAGGTRANVLPEPLHPSSTTTVLSYLCNPTNGNTQTLSIQGVVRIRPFLFSHFLGMSLDIQSHVSQSLSINNFKYFNFIRLIK